MNAEKLIGHTIGPYTIESILGRGGMAVVYRAQTVDQQEVALKVLFPPPNTEIITRFEREAQTAARLNHPAIVPILDSGHTEAHPYLVMPLIKGETLIQRLVQTGRLDEETVIDIGWQMADALYYAHTQGIVHRDVKPSNILLTEEGQALLTDFGVARALDDSALTRTGHTVGTPAYMAPEQAAGEQSVDGRADLYSLGVVLYQSVTGRLPFQGNTPQVLHAHVYTPPPPPSTIADLSPGLEAIILRALNKNVAERFQTGAAMAQALAHLEDQTTLPAPTPLPDPPPRPSFKVWPWVVVIILILLGLSIWQATPPAIAPTEETQPISLSTALAPTFTPSPTPIPSLSPTAIRTPTPNLPFPAGSLLQGSGAGVFRLNPDGTLYHIYDWETFLEFGFEETEIESTTDEMLETLPIAGELTRLIQDQNQNIYWVINGERWFIERWQEDLSQTEFQGLPPIPIDDQLLATLPLTLEAEDLPAGILIREGENIYRLFTDGLRHRFRSPDLFDAYGYDSESVVEIPEAVLHLYPNSSQPLTPLLQPTNSDEIFLITNGQKQPMPTGEALWELGYGLEDISQIPPEFLETFEQTAVQNSPSPTPEPPACDLSIAEPFSSYLTETPPPQPLDCPIANPVEVSAAWQFFENGLMLWRKDLDLIYVIGLEDRWISFGDPWREGDPQDDPTLVVPNGFYQPVRGFGQIWRERDNIQEQLGWGLGEEEGFTATIQEFESGLMLHNPETEDFIILYNDRTYHLDID